MRKFILLFVLCSSFITYSQIELKPGVKAGLNLANITNTNYEVKPDFYAGIFLGLKISERYTLQPEMVYSRQGARPELEGVSNSEIEIEYFSIGVANKYTIIEGVGLHAVAGPFFDFKIRDNIDFNPLFDIFGNFDIGFFAGLDYEFSSGFGIDFRYKHGFTDIGGIDSTSDKQFNNKVFQFGLSYSFKF